MATFVDRPVAIDAATDGQCMAIFRQFVGGDQLRGWARTEAVVAGEARTGQLEHAKSIFAIGDVGKQADIGDSQLDVVNIVDFSVRVVELIQDR